MKLLSEALLVLFGALMISGSAIAADSPMNIPGATTVDTATAHQLFKSGALFVDVRKDSDWEAGRISGAVHIELKKVYNEAALSEELGKDEVVVIYCNGHKCLRSSDACKKAVDWGFKKVHYYRDGYPAWAAAGLPTE